MTRNELAPGTSAAFRKSPAGQGDNWSFQTLPPQLQRLQKIWPTGPQAPHLVGGGTSELYFDRWSSTSDDPFELNLNFDIEDYVLSLPLASSNVVYNIGGALITDNRICSGEPFLNGPVSTTSRKVYRTSFDVFRLNISHHLLKERASEFIGHELHSPTILFGPHLNTDRVIQSLLYAAAAASGSCDSLCLESIGMAVADYLLRHYSSLTPKGHVSPLSKWCLARITEYIDVHLHTELSLRELSDLVGITRMHFVAQFKAATGITPHAYVLQRRIRAARPLLLGRTLSVEAVALAVGFRSPAHFANVFRKLVGETPSRWPELIAQGHCEKLPNAARAVRMRRVLDFIDTHLNDDLTVNVLAGVACLSAFHFSRVFTTIVGVPPKQYVTEKRLERAMELLKAGAPLCQVALDARFSSQASFTRAFKRMIGTTPGTYRAGLA